MDPEALARAIDLLIQNADKRYIESLTRIQAELNNQLLAILKDLELDAEGYIKQSANNRKILRDADKAINELFGSTPYTTAVSRYVSVIGKIDAQNVTYFSSLSESFSPNKQFLRNLQSDTIASIEKNILSDGLQSQVIEPLSKILNQNVNSGGKFAGFLEQVRNYILGNDQVEGRAMSYTRTYLRDSLFTYSRTYQQAITSDLGLTYYLYSGGVIDKSRPFCEERAGKFFSHKEIEAMASLEWAGKKQGTTESSIFLFAGGWNCAHQIIPVSTLIVPQEVIDRQ
jgi:hypothetical protein